MGWLGKQTLHCNNSSSVCSIHFDSFTLLKIDEVLQFFWNEVSSKKPHLSKAQVSLNKIQQNKKNTISWLSFSCPSTWWYFKFLTGCWKNSDPSDSWVGLEHWTKGTKPREGIKSYDSKWRLLLSVLVFCFLWGHSGPKYNANDWLNLSKHTWCTSGCNKGY